MVDTHAHLDFAHFDADRQQVIDECHNNGVEAIINVGVDLKSSLAGIKLAEEYDFIYATVGIHPHDAKEFSAKTVLELRTLAAHPKVVAIGEIGLDFYRNFSPPEMQKEAFGQQLALAVELQKPVVLHIRNALAECFQMLEGRKLRGVMHAFPGSETEANKAIAMGYHIGLGGPITYPGNRVAPMAATVPLSKILTETDCPYLPPQPFRGQRNRPDNVRFVISKLAEIFPRYQFQDIERITAANAAALFGIRIAVRSNLAYKIGRSLYLNLTNRCTNNCWFCPRNAGFQVAGYNLKLEREPNEEEIIAELDKVSEYDEIVFCGTGEPTLRADLMLALAQKLRSRKKPIRLNTNGQGNYINKRDLTKQLVGLVDVVNVSLNAGDAKTYGELCRPDFGPGMFDEVITFAKRCKQEGIRTVLSVVRLPAVDIAECERIAAELGVPLRIREYAS